MKDTLFIGDRAFSSWSLRGWLLYNRFNIAVQIQQIPFSKAEVSDQMAPYAPSRTVPTLRTADGTIVWDSLAIAEEVASRHPQAGLWPAEPSLRATARSLAAEMHSGFGALRNDCPMNLRCAYTSFVPSDAVRADLRRIETLWDYALNQSGGPWLCEEYSVADAFFAPVAARIAGYGLTVSASAQAYVAQHLNDPAFRRWRAMSLVHGPDLERYARDYDQGNWPGPIPLVASALASGVPENDACPYSGDSVTDFAQIEGRVFGFCNPFCRDKTVADAAAWPAFMALMN